ncbi:MAG: EamA/RhaT family transporter [Candidatus Cloacimonadota bacterium]|nr:MAG: EamA/RhaT family transporter [Candidatus Cloacimonadota bacterium]
MQNQAKAYLLASIVVLFWATAASAFKLSLRFLNTIELLFYSSLTATVVLFIIILFRHKIGIIRTYTVKDFLFSALLGFMNPFLYYLILFKAYSLLPGQIAQSLNFVWPIMIVLFSIPILKQKLSLKRFLAIFISFLGVILISTQGNFSGLKINNPLGVGLALSSSIIWAFFFVVNAQDKHDEECKLFLSFLFGTILISFLYLPKFSFPPLYGLLGAIYVGIFEMGIAFVFWIRALKLSQTTAQVSNLVYLTPFLALFFLRIFVGEKIFISTIVGIILIISGILYQRKIGAKS